MPTCTPIYGLTYPICSDRPCDVGDTFCEFTNGIEAELDRLDTVVNRVVDTIPQFEVSISAPFTLIGNNTVIGFDTVAVDTDNMVDLTADPFSFAINTLGRWFFYFKGSANGNIAVQQNWNMGVSNLPVTGAPNIPFQNYDDDGTINPSFLDGSGIQRYTTAGQRVRMFANPATQILLTATFGGYWIGDL